MKTGRPRKLDENVEKLIKVRISIARTSTIISQKDIATGFALSTATVRRYYFPTERDLSLKVAKAYALTKTSSRRCEDCDTLYDKHLKCVSCSILIHADPVPCKCGEQHGLTFDSKRCVNCAEAIRRVYNNSITSSH